MREVTCPPPYHFPYSWPHFSAKEPKDRRKKPFLNRAWYERFGGDASLDTFVGIGTFVRDRHADDPYYGSTLTLTPSYEVIEDLRVALFFSLSYEWTRFVTPCHPASGPRPEGAPQEDCSDTGDENGERWDLLDLELSVKHEKLVALGPFSLNVFGAIALPTSRVSRHADNILSLGAGTGVSFEMEPVTVDLGFQIYKHFPQAEAAVLDAIQAESQAAGGTPIGRCSGARAIGKQACVALSGFVADWNLKTEISAALDIPGIEGLATSLSFAYLYTRRFGRAPDEFTSPLANGVNHEDSTVGSFDVSYTLSDHFTFALGIFSWQPARTADGTKLRFPFYDFISPANNYTTWYTTFTASL